MEKKTVLGEAFGGSAVFKILDVLMDHPTLEYSKEDLAEVTGLSESTVHDNWENIENIDVVEESREYEGEQLYRFNQDSKIVEYLFKLDQELRTYQEAF